MSQFYPALEYGLNWEDPKRQYKMVPDKGGYAIAGVNSAAWPTEFEEIAKAADKSQAVFVFYQVNFWNPMRIGGIESQDLANRVFDEAINASSVVAVTLLQRALNEFDCKLKEDGIFGPVTMEAANSIDFDRVIAAYRKFRFSHYKAIVDHHPEDATYLLNWERRALG